VICVLVVGSEVPGSSPAVNPAVEILLARDADQAVERLARNRRIDAVLLLCGRGNETVLASILAEEPAPPPFYAPAGPPPPKGVRALAAASLADLLSAIAADLGD
jgi:hypothetical protein